jgi:hypothetical protein
MLTVVIAKTPPYEPCSHNGWLFFHNLIAERNNENEKRKIFYPLPRSLYDGRHFLRLWFKGQGFRGSHSKNHNNHRKADGSGNHNDHNDQGSIISQRFCSSLPTTGNGVAAFTKFIRRQHEMSFQDTDLYQRLT